MRTTRTHPSARPASLVAVTASLVLSLAACSSGSADDEAGASSPAPTTVTVANAKPTLTTAERRGETVTVEDDAVARGSVEVPFQPKAVIPFDLSALDTIDALGAGDAVVALPGGLTLPDYLSEYADLPAVGTLFEPDLEAISEIDPDLIITGARSTGQYDALSQLATTIDLSGAPGGGFDPATALERAAQLGEIFGKQDVAAAKAEAIEATIAQIKPLTEKAGSALVLQVTGGEYGAYAEGSRFGYFFDELGLTPAVAQADLPAAEGGSHGDGVSNEYLYQANPDWLIVFDRGAATGQSNEAAQEVLDNELVGRTTAAQKSQIVYLSPTELYILTNGLTSIETVLGEVKTAFSA
ncbi:siderophore ABC transporter substrate-binding protein [Xylanimonas allomyrinae]|nr:ABC transporter substrate-binding protein [Xylanimonas allomyrinae]